MDALPSAAAVKTGFHVLRCYAVCQLSCLFALCAYDPSKSLIPVRAVEPERAASLQGRFPAHHCA